MRIYLWIGLGSALGGMLRYGLAEWVTSLAGKAFPLGTLLVNVSGSFLIGVFAAVAQPSTGWWGSEHGRAQGVQPSRQVSALPGHAGPLPTAPGGDPTVDPCAVVLERDNRSPGSRTTRKDQVTVR